MNAKLSEAEKILLLYLPIPDIDTLSPHHESLISIEGVTCTHLSFTYEIREDEERKVKCIS